VIITPTDRVLTAVSPTAPDMPRPVTLPAYLQETYWWAYLHPAAVRLFERQWLINLILWGNFVRLRDAALDEIGATIDGSVLQVACVYGDFSQSIARRLSPTGSLDIIDVAQVQLDNVRTKLGGHRQVSLHHQDSTNLHFPDARFDQVVLFFLLHEQPSPVRRQTVAEAIRVLRPGGKLIVVDYHRPSAVNPFRYVMAGVLGALEPFAKDLWQTEISDCLPSGWRPAGLEKQTYFGDLYQKVVITR
jgi:ubiquinone/menaquinone biosynthesis C-methylase UbiE